MRASTGIFQASVVMFGHHEGDGNKVGGPRGWPPRATRLCSARQAVTSAVLRWRSCGCPWRRASRSSCRWWFRYSAMKPMKSLAGLRGQVGIFGKISFPWGKPPSPERGGRAHPIASVTLGWAGARYLLWTCSCSLWCSCCEMWVRPAMGALSHAPVPAPQVGTALAVCPLPRPSSPSAGRGQPVQWDPLPTRSPTRPRRPLASSPESSSAACLARCTG